MTLNDMGPAQTEEAWGRTGGHYRDIARRQPNQDRGIQTAFSARPDMVELQGIDERRDARQERLPRRHPQAVGTDHRIAPTHIQPTNQYNAAEHRTRPDAVRRNVR